MEWEKWPLYVQRRYALGKVDLRNVGSVCCAPLGEYESIGAREVVDWIYGVLTILDAKASTLMRLNGVLIAAAAFLLELIGQKSILSGMKSDAIVVLASAALSTVSIFLCLLVVNVRWGFLGKVTKDHGSRTFEFAEEIKSLDGAMRFRQTVYQAAWSISLIASIGFLAEFLMQARHVIGFAIAEATP